MAADVSATLDLDAKQFHSTLSGLPAAVSNTTGKIAAEGTKAGTGFVSGLSSGFSRLSGALSGVLGGLGIGIGLGAIVNKFEQVIERGSRIHDIAAKFGLDAEQLQLIGNAASQDGVSLEQVAKALNKLEIAGGKAGTKEISEALEKMNINSKAFVAANPAEKFFQVGEAWRNSAQGADEYAAVAALIGTRNTDLLVTLGLTRSEIEKISREFGILKTESVNALDAAGDSINKFNNQITLGFAGAIKEGSSFGSFLEKLNDQIKSGLEKIGLTPNEAAIRLERTAKDYLTTGGGEFGGKGAGSDWGEGAVEGAKKAAAAGPSGPAVNPFDIYAASLKAGVKPEDVLAAQKYAQSQGFTDLTGVDIRQAAFLQQQQDKWQSYIESSGLGTEATNLPPGRDWQDQLKEMTGDRGGSDVEEIAKALDDSDLLQQIANNTAAWGGNK